MARHATWERTIYIFLATAAAAAAATWPLLFFPYAIWNWILAKYLARGETCRILRFHDRDCSFKGITVVTPRGLREIKIPSRSVNWRQP